jgi:hypothetical protein
MIFFLFMKICSKSRAFNFAKVVLFCCYFWFTTITEFYKSDLPLGFLLFAITVGHIYYLSPVILKDVSNTYVNIGIKFNTYPF